MRSLRQSDFYHDYPQEHEWDIFEFDLQAAREVVHYGCWRGLDLETISTYFIANWKQLNTITPSLTIQVPSHHKFICGNEFVARRLSVLPRKILTVRCQPSHCEVLLDWISPLVGVTRKAHSLYNISFQNQPRVGVGNTHVQLPS